MTPDGVGNQKGAQVRVNVAGRADPGGRARNERWEGTAASKPRVVLLHYTAPPVVGGVEQVVGEQARLFAERGYAVTVVAGRADARSLAKQAQVVVLPEIDPEGETNQRIMAALAADMVVPEFRTLQSHIEQALRPIFTGNTLVVAHNVLNYHLHLPLTAALHHLLDEGAIRQMIAWCHDVSRYVNPTSGAPLRYSFPWDLLRNCRPQIKYVAVSRQRQRSLSHVLGCSPDLIRVIPDGIDPRAFWGLGDETSRLVKETELLKADLIILMPVRINRAKNIKRALEIVSYLRDMDVEVKLVVSGPLDSHALDGQAYLNELLAVRQKLGLDRQVVLMSQDSLLGPATYNVAPAGVAELYRLCDLVLLTSDREGFGLPVLEAGLSGRPIFTTEVPAVEEFEQGSVFGIERGELGAQVAQRIWNWAQYDTSYRLRNQVRHDYTWSIIFERHIEPLLRECTVPEGVQA